MQASYGKQPERHGILAITNGVSAPKGKNV